MLNLLPVTKHDFDESAVDLTASEISVSSKLVSAFSSAAIKVSCPEDQVLFEKGEPGSCVYLVGAGEAGLLLTISSTHAVCFRATTGFFLGLPAAFSEEPYSMTAIAWKGAELGIMSSDKFRNMISSNPAFSLDVLKILAGETRAARRAITTHLT